MRALFLVFVSLVVSHSAAAQQGRHPAFVDAADVVPGLVVEMRYSGSRNFVGRPIDGYERPVCLLTRRAALALAQVQGDLAPAGVGLKVFDCYRPTSAVAHFVRWTRDGADQQNKREYYPDMDKRRLFAEGYIAAYSGHSRGSTVDLTLVRSSDGAEVDMGSPFDFFGAKSSFSDRTVAAEARANRRRLATAMGRRGFGGYAKEWWHFTLANEPFPESYFDFPVR